VSAIGLLRDAKHSWKEGGWPSSPGLFFTCWAIFPVVFFSLSKSKLPGYVLPVIPPLQLLVAQRISLRVRKTLPENLWIRITSGVTLITLSVFTFLQLEWIDFGWAALVLAAGGFAMVFPALWRLSQALMIGVIALIVAVTLALTGATRRALDDSVSARSAIQIAHVISNNYSPELSSTYKLRRSFQYSLNFYFHRELPGWSPAQAQPGWVYAPAREISALRDLGLNCPFNALRHAVIVCEDPGSVNRRPGSGQPQ
jgi:4-amino-4-deoxy-L-arabinose transferase-like glycosyltransferase